MPVCWILSKLLNPRKGNFPPFVIIETASFGNLQRLPKSLFPHPFPLTPKPQSISLSVLSQVDAQLPGSLPGQIHPSKQKPLICFQPTAPGDLFRAQAVVKRHASKLLSA